jgi:hypothetical protein
VTFSCGAVTCALTAPHAGCGGVSSHGMCRKMPLQFSLDLSGKPDVYKWPNWVMLSARASRLPIPADGVRECDLLNAASVRLFRPSACALQATVCDFRCSPNGALWYSSRSRHIRLAWAALSAPVPWRTKNETPSPLTDPSRSKKLKSKTTGRVEDQDGSAFLHRGFKCSE